MQLYKLHFPNGKNYIGITSKTAADRFREHCKPYNRKFPVQHAIHKYGKENVSLSILAELDNWELLCLAEVEAIDKHGTFGINGYNMTLGGEGFLTVDVYGDERIARDKEIIEARSRVYYENNRLSILRSKKDYIKNNRESIELRAKVWRQDKKDHKSSMDKIRYEANREYNKERARIYAQKNKENIALKQKEWRELNKESISAQRKKYRENNKEKINQRKREIAKEKRTKKQCNSPIAWLPLPENK